MSASGGPRQSPSASRRLPGALGDVGGRARLGAEPLEAAEVDLVGRDVEHVPGVPGDEHVGAERLAQERDVVLERVPGRPRRALAPELLDQAVGRDRLGGVQEQRREERAVLAPRQVDRLPAVERFERAEYSEFHCARRFYTLRGAIGRGRMSGVLAPVSRLAGGGESPRSSPATAGEATRPPTGGLVRISGLLPAPPIVAWQVHLRKGVREMKWRRTIFVAAAVALTSVLAATAPASTVIVRSSLTVTVVGKGRVTSNPGGIGCPTRCHASFKSGAGVRLTARPASGWKLSRWSGACRGRGSCAVKLTSSKAVRAIFKKAAPPAPPSPPPPPPTPPPPPLRLRRRPRLRCPVTTRARRRTTSSGPSTSVLTACR